MGKRKYKTPDMNTCWRVYTFLSSRTGVDITLAEMEGKSGVAPEEISAALRYLRKLNLIGGNLGRYRAFETNSTVAYRTLLESFASKSAV